MTALGLTPENNPLAPARRTRRSFEQTVSSWNSSSTANAAPPPPARRSASTATRSRSAPGSPRPAPSTAPQLPGEHARLVSALFDGDWTAEGAPPQPSTERVPSRRAPGCPARRRSKRSSRTPRRRSPVRGAACAASRRIGPGRAGIPRDSPGLLRAGWSAVQRARPAPAGAGGRSRWGNSRPWGRRRSRRNVQAVPALAEGDLVAAVDGAVRSEASVVLVVAADLLVVADVLVFVELGGVFDLLHCEVDTDLAFGLDDRLHGPGRQQDVLAEDSHAGVDDEADMRAVLVQWRCWFWPGRQAVRTSWARPNSRA